MAVSLLFYVMSQSPPNIFYIHSHDTGRFISPYGYPARTPNLDRFARESTVFRKAFCGNPTCSPSRSVLLTGQYAHSAGMLGLTHRGFGLNDPKQHLAAFLGRNGYTTVKCGVQHEGDPATNGYQEIVKVAGEDEGRKVSSDIAAAAVGYLQQPRPKQPLFMSIGFFDTHRAFPQPEPEDNPDYTAPYPLFADNPAIRADAAAFNSSAHRLDAGVGMVLDAIEKYGNGKDSIIFVTTDHGPPFPDMKSTLLDLGIGVMMMLRVPARFNLPRLPIVDAPVSHVDFFPTLCDLLGIDAPDWLQGESLLPLWNGAESTQRGDIFAELNFHSCYEPMRAVRTERYKYIRCFDQADARILGNIAPGAPKEFLKEVGYLSWPTPTEQLFDLSIDPLERVNRIADPTLAEVRDDLQARLDTWMQQTNDPILNGQLPMLDGYKITPKENGW